jgi:A nuclease family of the HNH/ENDO VII superfamily with conserved AHH
MRIDKLFLQSFTALCVVVASNISIASISFSQTAYPPACGTKLTDSEKQKSRDKLRVNLPAHSYPVVAAPQAHHIFPLELFDSAIGTQVCKYGVNLLDGVENGIWLPNVTYAGRTNAPSLHRGPQNQTYKDYVTNRLLPVTNKSTAIQALNSLKNELNAGTLLINGAK